MFVRIVHACVYLTVQTLRFLPLTDRLLTQWVLPAGPQLRASIQLGLSLAGVAGPQGEDDTEVPPTIRTEHECHGHRGDHR